MTSDKRYYWLLGILLVVSAVTRGFIAGYIELGNDEVYYWTYARFPDLSHFDHPAMVGWMIQIFTFNLLFDSEFFVRLAAVVLGTGSTFLMFLVGKVIRDSRTGLIAALMYTASFYGFILSGLFILPDAPQVFFWLLTLYLLIRALPDTNLSAGSRKLIFLAGVTAGLALLSKYHAVFLLAGEVLYVFIYNRNWLRAKEFYASILISVILMLPILFWNIEHDFISFTYHEDRIGITKSGIQPEFFLMELVGQFFYNNPVNVLIIVLALIALIRKKIFIEPPVKRLLLLVSLPLIVVFGSFSLFRSTLPHWTGPGYLGLILIASAWLCGPIDHSWKKRSRFPWPVFLSLALLVMVLVVAVGQIRMAWIPLTRMKIEDVSLDLYGQRQLAEKFTPVSNWSEQNFLIDPGSPILTFRWFPAANFDYYIGRQAHKKVYAIGELKRIHKYYWINKERGNLPRGSDAWYIALSDDYEDPGKLYGNLYEMIIPSDTIPILRRGDTVRRAFVFRMIDLKEPMIFDMTDTMKTGVTNEMDTLLYFMKQIRSDGRWLKILEKKANEQGIPLDEMIMQEAKILRDSSNRILK